MRRSRASGSPNAPVPIGIWVGPSRSARLYGTPGAADGRRRRDGDGQRQPHRPHRRRCSIDGGEVVRSAPPTDELRNDSLSFQEARTLGALKLDTPDVGVPTIRSMVLAMDGVEADGRRARHRRPRASTTRATPSSASTLVRFSKLDLIDQLMHTIASPPVAYLMLLIGLALLVFEFFTAGVGVAGVVGAVCTFFGCYGLAALPARWWAVALIVLAMLAFAVDVQVGIPRFWTGVGIVLVVVGSWFLFEPLPGTILRVGWLTLLAGIGGIDARRSSSACRRWCARGSRRRPSAASG